MEEQEHDDRDYDEAAEEQEPKRDAAPMPKHTPGPWGWSDYSPSDADTGSPPDCPAVGPDCPDVTVAWIEMNVFTEPEWQANARLIAAAPEMLAFLVDLRELWKPAYESSGSQVYHRICELIAEATGEQAAVNQLDPWIECRIQLPPEGLVVDTKIDDTDGVRNEQPLKRLSAMWYFPDGAMYVYYAPTHWKHTITTQEAGAS